MPVHEIQHHGDSLKAYVSTELVSIQASSSYGERAIATVTAQDFADFIATLNLPAPRTQQVVRATEVETGRSLVLVAQDGGFWYDGVKTYNDEELHVQFANITEV